jgi:lipoate-protein ligase A
MDTGLLHRLPHRTHSAAENMAIDHGLAACAGRLEGGVLRFYGWETPALTFGYSQRFDEVVQTAKAIGRVPSPAVIVRRPSGGGIVDHRNDLTFAFALWVGHPLGRAAPARFYCLLHSALRKALQELGCPAALAPCPDALAPSPPRPSTPAACFVDPPVASDVIDPGTHRKIAGAALRRSPHGVLAQGSLDRGALPSFLTAERLEPIFARQLGLTFDLEITSGFADWPEELPTAADRERFASSRWNQKR